MSTYTPKPLWGFGWAGWCLLAVAIFLAAMMIAGVDVRFWIFDRIIQNFGWRALLEFAASIIPSLVFFDYPFLPIGPVWSWSPPVMRFSLTTMCLVLIALHIHPRRTGPLRIIALVILGLLPCLTLRSMGWFEPLFPPISPGGPRPSTETLCTFGFVSAVIGAPILMWITRSWRIGIIAAVFLLIGAWLWAENLRTATPRLPPLLFAVHGNETWFTPLAWAWNLIAFACLLTWAIRARQRVFPDHCCQSCGYDLRATLTGPCPECGASPSNVVEQPSQST